MLVVDSFGGHICLGVKNTIQEARTDLAVIPSSTTSQLQSLGCGQEHAFQEAPCHILQTIGEGCMGGLASGYHLDRYKKCYISSPLGSTENVVLWNLKGANKALNNDDCSASFEEDAAFGIDQIAERAPYGVLVNLEKRIIKKKSQYYHYLRAYYPCLFYYYITSCYQIIIISNHYYILALYEQKNPRKPLQRKQVRTRVPHWFGLVYAAAFSTSV